MDFFDNIPPIVGSRQPILIPAPKDRPSPSYQPPTPPSVIVPSIIPITSFRSRRKPVNVFKSPSTDQPGWEAHTSTTRNRATSPYQRVVTRRASSSTDTSRSSSNSSSVNAKVAVRNPPLLPLYHPLGPLALSLPKLDPGLFGLPSSLNVDDTEETGVGDPARPRRAAPKGDDDDAQSTGTPNGAAQDVQANGRNASPRKRRGGGAKRKRKDADDGDGVFPPPPKRTRNPRGAAANSSAPAAPSPLVGPAVVASDLVDDVAEMNGEVEEEAQEEAQAPKRSSRTRKPRTRPAKRRDSSGSASTATSVSASIAATTKTAADAQAAGPGQGGEEVQPNDKGVNGVNGLDRREEEETADTPAAVRTPVQEVEQQQESQPTTGSAPAAVHKKPEVADVRMNGLTPTPAVLPPAPLPPAAASPPPPVPISAPQKEEREEGELSDDAN